MVCCHRCLKVLLSQWKSSYECCFGNDNCAVGTCMYMNVLKLASQCSVIDAASSLHHHQSLSNMLWHAPASEHTGCTHEEAFRDPYPQGCHALLDNFILVLIPALFSKQLLPCCL